MASNRRYNSSDLHERPKEYYPSETGEKFDITGEQWAKFGEPHPTDVKGVYLTEEDVEHTRDIEHTLKILEHFDIAVPSSVFPMIAGELPSEYDPDRHLETEFQSPEDGYRGQYHRISGLNQSNR